MGMMKYKFYVAIAIAIYGLGFFTAYKWGEAKFTEYQLNVANEKAELQDKINKINAENQKRMLEVEGETQVLLDKQRIEHEKNIRDIRRNFKPSGVYNCSRTSTDLSRTNSDTANLVCYRESELRRKIEKTLDIGYEADKMSVKCNSILKLIEERKIQNDNGI